MSSRKDLDSRLPSPDRTVEIRPEREVTDQVSLHSDNETAPSNHTVTNLILRNLSDAKEEATVVYDIDVDTAEEVIKELDRLIEKVCSVISEIKVLSLRSAKIYQLQFSTSSFKACLFTFTNTR